MAGGVRAEWGHGERTAISSAEQLDALLDRIDAEARSSGRPQDVQLVGPDQQGTLGIVVGHDRGLLNHVPADHNPPYLTTVGGEDQGQPFTFYVAGGHHSETHWRHTVAAADARAAARLFVQTGELDPRLEWTDV